MTLESTDAVRTVFAALNAAGGIRGDTSVEPGRTGGNGGAVVPGMCRQMTQRRGERGMASGAPLKEYDSIL